ncbi:ABC transporter permease [Hansschlegelia zhihuaiae]|uniref:Iron ABC transporter permease n=1 Tax=Hansschlegelia zhihuaiae TaxID=405005 RepID=A0A4Q0M5K2_9HYPH|nr:iron ABC transporter permease [Hansschlegelia zhihuaiae]RXF68235.1 iron ABC transporter permease [Hansschlegelia zhihuaiae]
MTLALTATAGAPPWRARGSGWVAAVALIALLPAAPVASLALTSLQGSWESWPNLIRYVLPDAALQSVALLVGVGVFVAAVGCGAAWLVTAYEFPGRRALSWLLLLPLAIPTYVVAYAYLDLTHPLGPIQGAIRWMLGYHSPREFRLPDIRGMTGCILLLGLVLYPYVYLAVRATFLGQSGALVEAARTLGVSRSGVFWRVALPLARPAVALGVSLALMEALNDVGASEFLGVKTVTLSVYSTWVTRSDLPGAAQIALAMLILVVGLVAIERWGRRRQRFAAGARSARPFAARRLTGWKAAMALALGALPVLFGFALPAGHIANEAWKRLSFAGFSGPILSEIGNTVMVSAAATVIVVALGAVAAYAARLKPLGASKLLARVSTIGYAIPGTVVVIGLLAPIGAIDGAIASTGSMFGVATGLALVGSGAALTLAYAVRFLAIGVGGAEAGLARVPLTLDGAARTLGDGPGGAFLRVHLPLAKGSIAAAALLVFVDVMKELPATLLIRPLNFETLATHLYAEAARGTYEDGAIAALIIVAVGILPVILLSRIGEGVRRTSESSATLAKTR